MRARATNALSLALVAIGCAASTGACSDSIDVLDSLDRDATPRDDAAVEPTPPRRDGSVPMRPDATTPPQPGSDGGKDGGRPDPPAQRDAGGSMPPTACTPGCSDDELCAIDRCVDALGIAALALSFTHACEVAGGQLFCWGANESGQLGVGDANLRDRRARVGTWNDWLDAAVGEHSSCAIRAPGNLYCWGNNTSGELGLGDTEPRSVPALVGDRSDWKHVACGGESCCALDADDVLYCWGANREGKIGQADLARAPDVTRPTQVVTEEIWRTIAVGQGHVCGITHDGELYCWGRNSDVELGVGSTEPPHAREPTRIGDAGDWRAIAASQHHTCGVRDDGSLWCWGGNTSFELAAPAEVASASAPLRVGSDSDWQDVSVGWFHSCALKRDGSLFCWGRAIEGQLGQGMRDEPLPAPGMVVSPARWRRVQLGHFYTCGIDSDEALHCWGTATDGVLGLGDGDRRYVPALVP